MKLSAALAVLLIAAVGLLAWTSFADPPWESDDETPPYQQQLTGTEAAVILETRENDARENAASNDPLRLRRLDACEALEYNATTNEWIVRCAETYTSGAHLDPLTYRLADATGDYERVE